MAAPWIIIGLAGAASALLYLSLTLAAPAALLLVYLAPLPLFLAGLGLGTTAAAAAGIAATAAIAVATTLLLATGYFVLVALSAGLVVRQALLSRPTPEGGIEWYPPGHLVTGLAAAACLAIAAAGVLVVGPEGEGGLEAAVRAVLRDGIERLVEVSGPPPGAEGTPTNVEPVIDLLAPLVPAMLAGVWLFCVVVNGALAQGLLVRFGRNLRPSPAMAELVLPRILPLALLAIAAGLALLAGEAGYVGQNLLVIAAVPFFFAGLGVAHAVIAGWQARSIALVALYGIVFVFGWPAIILALLGAVDHAMPLRGRIGPGAT